MDQHHYKSTQIANTLIPALGFAGSLPGLLVLITRAHSNGNALSLATAVIYGLCLVVSYAVFTLYHVFKFHEKWGRLFKILDHATIYLLIAGSYTPFALISLRGTWGWALFATVWAIAVAGIILKIFFIHRFKVLGPLSYLLMGWLIIFLIKPAIELIPRAGFHLLLAGGLFYSFGLVFYAWKRLLFHHAIWHLFVVAGSVCHYFSICLYVIPPSMS